MKNARNTVRSIIADTFKIRLETLPANADSDRIERWDSLGHVTLVAALSKAFSVEIPDERMIFLTSEDAIMAALEELEAENDS